MFGHFNMEKNNINVKNEKRFAILSGKLQKCAAKF